MPIVEESYRDQFWGAKPLDSDTLYGENALGRLLTKLREKLKGPEAYELQTVAPLPLERFYLVDKPISVIEVCQPGAKPNLTASPQELVTEELIMDALLSASHSLQPLECTPHNQHGGDNPGEHYEDAGLDGGPSRRVPGDLEQGLIDVVERHRMDDGLHHTRHVIDREVGTAEEHHREADQQDDGLSGFGLLDETGDGEPDS